MVADSLARVMWSLAPHAGESSAMKTVVYRGGKGRHAREEIVQ